MAPPYYSSLSPSPMSLSILLRQSLSLLVAVLPLVCGEIRDFRVMLDPDSKVIHYSEGYLLAPGYVDLSDLRFISTMEADFPDNYEPSATDDQEFPDETDDLVAATDDTVDVDTMPPVQPTEGQTQLPLPSTPPAPANAVATPEEGNSTQPGGGGRNRLLVGSGVTQLDVAVLHLPGECANTRSGCDWTELGVGARTDDGDLFWCCSNEAVEMGLCEGGPKYGSLIVNNTRFFGSHRYVEVPPTGQLKDGIRYGKIEEPAQSGRFIIVFANCNDQGRQVLVTGATVWKSVHGYLPGELFEFMYFYYLLALVYLTLVVCYGFSMLKYSESRIPIELWMFATILMGLLETLFRSGDYFAWNLEGTRLLVAIYIGVFMGVLKRAVSRCLIVMVSLGWGVVRDSLGATMPKIVFLGIFYIGVSAVRDFMVVIAVEDMQTLSMEEEDELFDVVQLLTFVVAAIDVTFILWILDSLNGTMEYLENMNQTRKLMRYLRLRCIFLFTILFAVVWGVFNLVDTYDEDGILEEQHEWIVEAAKELNYLFLLIGVAVLWWPNPNAKEYAYVMELPALGGEDGENELELTGGVVPSAVDDEDDDVGAQNGKGAGFGDEFQDEFK